ncbi:MAG: Rrf2 family transcriptional regulator [Candidatus Omnitrophica bacterium]|jgi:Rrf2 family protein|nr:Rrf2 family transcriptional regulator [Candidatus Omnitrophota bacterium]
MKYTTKTEYGLNCLIYMAKHGGLEPITIKEIAAAEKYSLTYIEKILQSLRAAGIVAAQHGNHGGYVLAKDTQNITLKSVIDALEGSTFDIFCEPEARDQIVCTHYCACGVKPVWQKAKSLLDDYFGSVTLEMILNNKYEPEPVR